MSETQADRISWARRIRQRWGGRRVIRAATEFVWLRLHCRRRDGIAPSVRITKALNIRLSIHPSFERPGVMRSPLVPQRVIERSFFHRLSGADTHSGGRRLSTLVTSMFGRLDRRGAPSVMLRRQGPPRSFPSAAQSAWGSPSTARTWTSRGQWPLRIERRSTSSHAGFDISVTRALRQLHNSDGAHWAGLSQLLRAATTVARSSRREDRAVAPPPMVSRAPRSVSAQSATPAALENLATSAPIEARVAWPTTMPSAGSAMPSVSIAALTEQVMQQINDRVRAKRERLGKV